MEITERFLLVDQLNGVTYKFEDGESLMNWVNAEYDFDPADDTSSDNYTVASHAPSNNFIALYMTPVWVKLTVRDEWVPRIFIGGKGEFAHGEDYYVGKFFCQDKQNPHKNCVWYQMRTVK